MNVKTRDPCIVRGSNKLVPTLSSVDRFVTSFVEEPKKDNAKGLLELTLCNVGDCGYGLLPLRNTFDHRVLNRGFLYRSGIGTAIVKGLAETVFSAEELADLSSRDVYDDPQRWQLKRNMAHSSQRSS